MWIPAPLTPPNLLFRDREARAEITRTITLNIMNLRKKYEMVAGEDLIFISLRSGRPPCDPRPMVVLGRQREGAMGWRPLQYCLYGDEQYGIKFGRMAVAGRGDR
jgi:hypothetical protein